MPKIIIKNLVKKFSTGDGDVFALNDINLEIMSEKYNTLLGPSGCGKTTLLRMIAGLDTPTSGEMLFDEKNVSNLSTQERNIGFVFQHFAIFPHLDVWHNVSYGSVVKGLSPEEIKKITETNLKIVGLDKRSSAMPNELSGGMRQRLGLARALASSSDVLLLDEPLSALDAKISAYLRLELKRIAMENKMTSIHVTHNQEEAMVISDNIILMKKGRIVQAGAPEEIYNHPNSIFAANFIGKCNFFHAERIGKREVKVGKFKLKVAKDLTADKVILGIRPEKIHLRKDLDEELMEGPIESINFMGHLNEYEINVDGTIVKSYKRIKERDVVRNFKIGDNVELLCHPEDIFVFDEPEDLQSELNLE